MKIIVAVSFSILILLSTIIIYTAEYQSMIQSGIAVVDNTFLAQHVICFYQFRANIKSVTANNKILIKQEL